MLQVAPAVGIKHVSVQGAFKTGELEPKMGFCILFFEWENPWPGIPIAKNNSNLLGATGGEIWTPLEASGDIQCTTNTTLHDLLKLLGVPLTSP